MSHGPVRTTDGRHIVVNGRRWRATDPELPGGVRQELTSALGRARSAVRRAADEPERRRARDQVQLAKEGLGERGTPWWDLPVGDRLERARESLQRIRRNDWP